MTLDYYGWVSNVKRLENERELNEHLAGGWRMLKPVEWDEIVPVEVNGVREPRIVRRVHFLVAVPKDQPPPESVKTPPSTPRNPLEGKNIVKCKFCRIADIYFEKRDGRTLPINLDGTPHRCNVGAGK